MLLEVEVVAATSPEVVWDVLTEWERQPDWMLDAIDVQVVTPEREGRGVTIVCPTRLLGFTVDDVMRVTAWEPPRRLEVVHLGRVITGTGGFELQGNGAVTTIRWWERIEPPLGAVGRLGARWLVLPFLRRLFMRSLTNLAGLAEQEAVRRSA